MKVFETDVNSYGDCVNETIQKMEEFRAHFETIKENFIRVHELNAKSKLMKKMVEKIVKQYDRMPKK